MCGGCVGSVTRILESHDSVTSASVNLATETALVRVSTGGLTNSSNSSSSSSSDNGASGGSMDALAAALAARVTDAGFEATVRDPDAGAGAAAATMRAKRDERRARLAKVTRNLFIAWLLAGTCLAGHLLHCWPGLYAAPAIVQALASVGAAHLVLLA